jgi:putative ABC transport system permease protein
MTRAAAALERVGSDLRYAARSLAGSPGFTLAAVLTLGVGIGATVAIFSLNYQVLLKPLPYREPGQLVSVWGDASYRGVPKSNVSPPDYLDLQQQTRTVSGLAAYMADFETTAATAEGRAERVDVRMVSGNFFELLGVPPALGRALDESDDRAQPPAGAVISHGFWQRRFGGDPRVLGSVVDSEPGRFRIVGVMPPEFQFGAVNTDVWMPLRSSSSRDWENRTNYALEVVGRLKAGTTVEQAQQEMDSLARRLAAIHLGPGEPRGARVLPLRDEFAGSVRRNYAILFGGAVSALLVACLNVAHLLLLRGIRRHRELAVRASLGASRAQLIQQVLVESALLTAAASVIGLLVHEWTSAFFMRFVPTSMAGITELRVDAPVMAFMVLAATAVVCLSGLMPAFRITNVRLSGALDARAASPGRRATRLRQAIVTCEVAVAVLLLVCATLFVATLWRLHAVDPGFNPTNVLTANVVSRDLEQVLERVAAMPDVISAGVGTVRPLEAFPGRFSWSIQGREPDERSSQPRALLRTVGPRFLETLQVPLLAGRFVDEGDLPGAEPVVVINDSMRRRYWGGADPIGARITRGATPSDAAAGGGRFYTVVGVVGDVKQRALNVESEPEVIVPYRQYEGPRLYLPRTLVVRTRSSATALVDAVRREIGSIDPALPLPDVLTMEQMVETGLGGRQRTTTLWSGFSSLALALAILGVYAIVSSAVIDRTREIGVRMALGARPSTVLRMLIAEGVSLAAIGSAAGLLGAVAVTRVFEGALFGVSPLDPFSFAGAALLMVSIAFAASYVPARRSIRINLRTALSGE